MDNVTEWPDALELQRWQRALDEIAERIGSERGVRETASLSSHHATLWANFGDLRVRVAGSTAEVSDEAELFGLIDFWVAFERRGAPGQLLDRDLDVIAEWNARLPAAIVLWQQAAAVVFADVEATTDIRWTWQVTLHEDEEDWSALRTDVREPGVHAVSVTQVPTGWKPARRALLLPELWLEADRDATTLGVGHDLNDAIGFVAGCVQNWVMDHIRRAWPKCPRHEHPADLGNLRARPTWVCPLDDQLMAEIGKLGGNVGFEVASREMLRHNPLNAVTAVVERVTDTAGHTLIRKELRRPDPRSTEGTAGAWAASTDPEHWNYWRREADAYLSAPLREGLHAAGLDMPAADVEETDTGVVLWLEDVSGTPGTEFSLADHAAIAAALGSWHAQGPLNELWASRRFLRNYSASKPARYELVEDDAAWRQPLIANLWPAALRDGWRRLLASRETLLTIMESLPRTRSHLDVWVSNEIRRPSGPIVLLDWAFAGDGAIGEDLGNHIPDAVFDLFWPAERIAELDEICFDAYLRGLHEAGWHGDERDVRLGVAASCVKYAWLLPRLLESASAASHQAYHQTADSEHLYQQRGAALMHLVTRCDEALLLGTA